MSNKSVNPLLKTLLLKPLSMAYGAITGTRNKMFDIGILSQRKFDIPVLVVGNIAVGGTGKTPHTEYLVELLHYRFHIAVLSRGYNRKTSGFVLASDKTGPREIGDEPYQIYRKYGKHVTVAVCEDRCKGIDELRVIDPSINLVILDDAFQHRYVRPTVAIVLTEHSRPVYNDSVMPAGHLRESAASIQRADMVIVTKCPAEMRPMDYRIFVKRLNLQPWQKLYFTKYLYGPLRPLFPSEAISTPFFNALGEQDYILAVAGVANPRPFIKHLRSFRAKVKALVFPDHHNFNKEDILLIRQRLISMPDPQRTFIVTTEKDAMRLSAIKNMPKELRSRMFYQPIKVSFIPNPASENSAGSDDFENTLIHALSKHNQK